jgi:hypothetical protein
VVKIGERGEKKFPPEKKVYLCKNFKTCRIKNIGKH